MPLFFTFLGTEKNRNKAAVEFVMLLMFKGKAKAYITAWPVICVTMSKLEEVFTVVADIE